MNVKRVVGIILATLGILMVIFYSYMAFINQESYSRLMCAVAWVESCVSINNAIMWGMGYLAIGLVLLSVGGVTPLIIFYYLILSDQ